MASAGGSSPPPVPASAPSGAAKSKLFRFKSHGNISQIPSSLAISKPFMEMRLSLSTSSVRAVLVKTSAWPANRSACQEREVVFLSKPSKSYEKCSTPPTGSSQDIFCGKTFQALSPAIIEKIFAPCLKKSDIPSFQCLTLTDGHPQEWSELQAVTSPGASWTLNTGESPSAVSASSLSQILQPDADVPLKFSLSAKACHGILRRAKDRGKILPKHLVEALERQMEA